MKMRNGSDKIIKIEMKYNKFFCKFNLLEIYL